MCAEDTVAYLTAKVRRKGEEIISLRRTVMFYIDEARRYRHGRSAALALLREWRDTPFFATEEEWRAWVSEYGPRVEAFLREAADDLHHKIGYDVKPSGAGEGAPE